MKATKKKGAGPAALDEQGALTLRYGLAELPSVQHRAGLAGLVLMLEYLPRAAATPGKPDGVCEIVELSEDSLTVRLDQAGLVRLFDILYAADEGEIESPQVRKTRSGEIDPPKRELEKEVVDEKGKRKTKKVYIYPTVIPKGPLAQSMDPDPEGRWTKLWRDMVWSILRGVPATRAPFEARAAKEPTRDAQDTWEDLLQPLEHAVDLPSTYYLGAQANTAENVPFYDRARYRFLLHFWPYVAQIYVPAVLAKPQETRRDFVGFALAIPDVARLQTFCEELPRALRQRSPEVDGYRPRECIVYVALESALDMSRRLRARLAAREGGRDTQDLVLDFEVLHVNKEGNNVRLLSAARITPTETMQDQYERCRELRDLIFRRQVLLNLLAQRPWYHGFDELAASLPYEKQLIGSEWFRRDARRMFEIRKDEVDMAQSTDGDGNPALEALLYRVVQSYVLGRLESKHGLSWDKDKMKEASKERVEFNDKKAKIAKDAFLAVRSRTGKDFVDYFSSTICSVRHPLSKDDFVTLAQALRDEKLREDVRTITLLALSVHG